MEFSKVLSAIGDVATVGANVGGALSQIHANSLNYRLAKENLDYQKALQKMVFAREDTAVQRRVRDLKAAGLSPTLAAGSAASSGSVISTSAPRKESDLEALANIASIKTLIAQQHKAQTEADIAKTQNQKLKAEVALTNIQKHKMATDAQIARNLLKQNKMDTDYYLKFGVSPVQSSMGWKQALTNLIVGFLNPSSTVSNALTDLANKAGDVTNESGATITNAQASYLKQVGLYKAWKENGFTKEVTDALQQFSKESK